MKLLTSKSALPDFVYGSTVQKVNVIEKTAPKDVKKVVKKDSEERAVELQ